MKHNPVTGAASNHSLGPGGQGRGMGSPGTRSRGSEVVELLQRMRAGDREAAALFITRYGGRIRRRIRGKLSPAMRRIFDSQDILSTLGRRLDHFVLSGKLKAGTEQELWALIFRMADNAVVDKSRLFRRLQQVEKEDSRFARELSSRLRHAQSTHKGGVEIEIDRALNHLHDGIDRQILLLWLAGTPQFVIAEHVDLAATAVRKRWQKIRSKLQRKFLAEIRR